MWFVSRRFYNQQLIFPLIPVQPKVQITRTRTVSVPAVLTVAKLSIGARSVVKEQHEVIPQAVKLDASSSVELPQVTQRLVSEAAQVVTGAFGQPKSIVGSGSGQGVAVGGFGSGSGLAGSGNALAGSGNARVVAALFERQSAPASVPVAVHESIQQPVIISEHKPIYTEAAHEAHVSGTVVLRVRFTAEGSVKVLGVLQGLGYGLDEAAIRTAESIKFTPGMLGGHPVAIDTTARFTFQMP
jgi:TonB family protein